jgi:hypothetical protein
MPNFVCQSTSKNRVCSNRSFAVLSFENEIRITSTPVAGTDFPTNVSIHDGAERVVVGSVYVIRYVVCFRKHKTFRDEREDAEIIVPGTSSGCSAEKGNLSFSKIQLKAVLAFRISSSTKHHLSEILGNCRVSGVELETFTELTY